MSNVSSFRNTTSTTPRKILIITSDLPSHPYATAKLAVMLSNAGDSVRLAAPQGPALERCLAETQNTHVQCIPMGTVVDKGPANARPVVDPHSWTAFWGACRFPFPYARGLARLFDDQEGMYEPIYQELSRLQYDLIVPIHTVAVTVCDAAEWIEQSTGTKLPLAIFSSLPYDPAVYLGERKAWHMLRTLTAFPHVSTYSSNVSRNNPVRYLVRLLWQLLDAWLTARAWQISAVHNDARRKRRGLGHVQDGWRGYMLQYPVLSLGGMPPFLNAETKMAPHVTPLGSLEAPTAPIDDPSLQRWLNEPEKGIIYVSFGTGTILSNNEAAEITGGLLNELPTSYSILFALRSTEQQRLRPIFDTAVGSTPTSDSPGRLDYVGGRLRIEASVPQVALLSSGRVKVFISHMGMGGFAEGCAAAVPFVCYPSGGDQYFNAQRAVEAGIARRGPRGLVRVRRIVREVLEDRSIHQRSKEIALQLSDQNGAKRALRAIHALTIAYTKPGNNT